jgi:hypothetical protein
MKQKPYLDNYKNVFKTDKETHETVVKHCKDNGYKIYVWVRNTLLNAIKENKN